MSSCLVVTHCSRSWLVACKRALTSACKSVSKSTAQSSGATCLYVTSVLSLCLGSCHAHTFVYLLFLSLSMQSSVRPLEVKVEKLEGNVQKYAVWLGGSLLAEQVRRRPCASCNVSCPHVPVACDYSHPLYPHACQSSSMMKRARALPAL